VFRVSVYPGALCLNVFDFSLPAPLPLWFFHGYTSDSKSDGRFGAGWVSTYDLALARGPRGYALRRDGEVLVHGCAHRRCCLISWIAQELPSGSSK